MCYLFGKLDLFVRFLFGNKPNKNLNSSPKQTARLTIFLVSRFTNRVRHKDTIWHIHLLSSYGDNMCGICTCVHFILHLHSTDRSFS
jgi:hypothetical protein